MGERRTDACDWVDRDSGGLPYWELQHTGRDAPSARVIATGSPAVDACAMITDYVDGRIEFQIAVNDQHAPVERRRAVHGHNAGAAGPVAVVRDARRRSSRKKRG